VTNWVTNPEPKEEPMTITEQTTTTDRTLLGVTFPAALVKQAQQSAAAVRAILSDARPILERAAAVLGEIRDIEAPHPPCRRRCSPVVEPDARMTGTPSPPLICRGRTLHKVGDPP
jgi:hypothetical protein